MNYKVMKKWVKALRSGKYKQTRSVLQDSFGYCCLGVLCDITPTEVYKYKNFGILTGGNLQGQSQVQEWAGLKTPVGEITENKVLAELNDKGYSFKRLATLIEKHWREL